MAAPPGAAKGGGDGDGGKRVAFVHLDLGIGGAEQLVVHAAVGLRRHGHHVTMFTSHHDPKRCFPPTVDGTFDVRVFGDFLPRAICGRFHALCSLLRMLWVCLRIRLSGQRFDVIVNDQVSTVNPFLIGLCARLVFYIHFPDLLLCTERGSAFKRLYRWPLDALEERTTTMASTLLVNSAFTADVVRTTFPSMAAMQLQVLYPPVDLHEVDAFLKDAEAKHTACDGQVCGLHAGDEAFSLDGGPFFLSLNRYERKKDVRLAILAFSELLSKLPPGTPRPRLVVAGGHDERVRENVEYHAELVEDVRRLGFPAGSVHFLRSVPNTARWLLLWRAAALVYTPHREHFGMVPCEAMAVGTPVIAADSGGPRESVEDGKTGWLCQPPESPGAFAAAMRRCIDLQQADPDGFEALRARARERMRGEFGLEAFAGRLDALVRRQGE